MDFHSPFVTPMSRIPGAMRLAACAALLAGLCGAPVGPARAADAAAPGVPAGAEGLSKGELKAQREFKLLDFNRDGRLSRQEIALVPRLAAVFDDADTDRDGYVTYDEVRAFAAVVRARREQQREQAAAATPLAPASAERPGTAPADAPNARR